MGFKKQTRRLKHKRQRKYTHKRRRGGTNNNNNNDNNNNNQYDDRRTDLINRLQDMIGELEQRVNSGEEDIDVMEYIDPLQGPLMDEAIDIDTYYGNRDMLDIILELMNDVHRMLGLFNPNRNNNKTVTIQGNNNNRSNTDSVISVYNKNYKKSTK